ncbi:MAG: transcription-repair coupling factor, partial [Acidimicrobiales bacterium]
MAETGLTRVLERVAPTLRALLASDALTPSSYATPLAVGTLALDHPQVLAVVATSADADALAQALGALLGEDDVALWPAWDTHPLERVSPDVSVMAARSLVRWRVVRGVAPRVIVASARSISQILAPGEAPTPLEVRRGESRERDELLARLVATGYRRESLVEHRAEFAVRGGIVDEWPAQASEPVRLDFFGDEIERLTIFDVATQRSREDLEHVVIAPAREWIPSGAVRESLLEVAAANPWTRPVLSR